MEASSKPTPLAEAVDSFVSSRFQHLGVRDALYYIVGHLSTADSESAKALQRLLEHTTAADEGGGQDIALAIARRTQARATGA